jgi:hypothetical protein
MTYAWRRSQRLPYIKIPFGPQAERRLRRQHLALRVHRLGDRAFFEFIDELDRHHALGDDLDQRLEKYAGADADLLRAIGADRFSASPVRTVGGGR